MIHSLALNKIIVMARNSSKNKRTTGALFVKQFARFRFEFFAGLVLAAMLGFAQPAYSEVEYEVLDWNDLMPPMDLAAIQSQSIDHGSGPDDTATPTWESDDVVGSEMNSWDSTDENWQQDAYQSALTSTRTVDTLNGKDVKLPGFIVPLEFDDELTVTQFFLVPYFGACIHLPPPPPNQMVLVDYPEGIKLDALYTPFWVSGELSIQIMENDMGISAYAMQMDSFELYEY